jgi:type I restriction enzyme, S subunit
VWREDRDDIAFQKALHRVRIVDSSVALPDYVALMLEEYIKAGRANRLFTGTTIKHLPQEKLRQIEIPLPRLDEQRDTVDRLDVATQVVDRFESQVQSMTASAAALKKSLLHHAFTGRLTGCAGEVSHERNSVVV